MSLGGRGEEAKGYVGTRDGACFHMRARSPPGWNPVFSARCVHARTVVCNIRIFIFFSPLCLDVSVVAVSVIHGEQLHASLREKPTHENVGENDVKEKRMSYSQCKRERGRSRTRRQKC